MKISVIWNHHACDVKQCQKEDCVTDDKDDWMRRQQQQDERLANDIEYILSEDWYVDTLRAEALPSS